MDKRLFYKDAYLDIYSSLVGVASLDAGIYQLWCFSGRSLGFGGSGSQSATVQQIVAIYPFLRRVLEITSEAMMSSFVI